MLENDEKKAYKLIISNVEEIIEWLCALKKIEQTEITDKKTSTFINEHLIEIQKYPTILDILSEKMEKSHYPLTQFIIDEH